jgi:putative RecB family exonuclease
MERFSYSKVTTYRNCPKAYEFRYVLHETERFSTIERHMGTAVHEALRWGYAQKLANRRPDPTEFVECFERQWRSSGLSRAIVVKQGLTDEDYRTEGRRMVEAFAREVFTGDRSATLGLESRFELDLDEGVRLTGIIDRISRSPRGMLRIIDYKTGAKVPNPLSDPQLTYYAAWVFEQYEDATAELSYVDLRNGRELTAEFHRGAIVPHIEKLVAEIDRIRRTEEFEANPSLLCKWCGYSPICADAAATAGASRDTASHNTSRLRPPGGAQCPDCGDALISRNGRYGSFIGCSGYPRCRYTRDDW